MHDRDAGGFTLIELLIVVVVLGIVAAIVVFAVGSVGKDAVAAACKADGRTVESASSVYVLQHGAPAPSAADLVPGYVRSWPASDRYVITYAPSSGTNFTVYGVQSDGRACYPTSATATGTTPASCTVTSAAAAPSATGSNHSSGHLDTDVTVTAQVSGTCSGLAITFTPGFASPTLESLPLPDPSGGSTSLTIGKNAFKWSVGVHAINVIGAAAGASTTLVVS